MRTVATSRRRKNLPTQHGGVVRPGPSVLVVAAVLLAAACGSSGPAATLADGSTSASLPPALKRLGPTAVLTTERTLSFRALDARGRACVALSSQPALAPGQPFVERLDHYGASMTFRPRGGPFVVGCMSVSTTAGANGVWCGHVVGEIRDGHLVDPRLDIACRATRDGATGQAIGSAWIEPVAHARWIIVRGHALIQIYPVPVHSAAAALPIRVTTRAVDVATATAVFRIEQYDTKGTRVSESTIRTAVAG